MFGKFYIGVIVPHKQDNVPRPADGHPSRYRLNYTRVGLILQLITARNACLAVQFPCRYSKFQFGRFQLCDEKEVQADLW